MGPTGAGKSTLVNALVGGIMAEVHRGARSVAHRSKRNVHEGEFLGVKIRVYDTVGFGDTEGRSDHSIIEEIAHVVRNTRVDLVLVCMRMDCRASREVQEIFASLSDEMPTKMWKRTVVVLTFANVFFLQGLPGTAIEEIEKEVMQEIEEYRNQISKVIKKEILSDVPFCIAGRIYERKLPTSDDWLLDLWKICLQRFSDDTKPLFETYSMVATFIAIAVLATTVVGPAAVRVRGSGLFSQQGSTLGEALGTYVSRNIVIFSFKPGLYLV
uniref:AIG1-type G domain-containing protein n=1 Tax=Amphimedon queenslandica TaxID=400682 RepID=A0A1X7SIR1_AMPQE